MSERADIIQRRILQIEDRIHHLTVRLRQLEAKPERRPRLIGVLMELSRRPALEQERDALIEQRSKLERDYESLPEPLKS